MIVRADRHRIDRLRPPVLIDEWHRERPTVSTAALLNGTAGAIEGTTDIGPGAYDDELLASGFPGIRSSRPSTHATQLDSYVSYALSHEVPAWIPTGRELTRLG